MNKFLVNSSRFVLFFIFVVSAMAAYVPYAITSGTNKMRIESACVGGNSDCTSACTAGTCTISKVSTSGWIVATYTSTGLYSHTYSGFSSAPLCICTDGRDAGYNIACGTSTSTTGTARSTQAASGAATDEQYNILCMGPR